MGLGDGVNPVEYALDGGKFSGVNLLQASMGAHVPLQLIFGSNLKSKNPNHSLFQASNSQDFSIYHISTWKRKPTRPAIEPPYRWRDWAAKPDGITGDEP